MSRRLLLPLSASVLFGLAALAPASIAQSQDAQSQSIADAARRSRDLKKNSAKSSKVITDDDLEKKKVPPGEQGVPANAAPAPDTQQAVTDAAADQAPAPSPADAAEKAAEARELAKLKAELAQALKELDLDQRELALDQDTHLSIPDYQHDEVGKAKVAADQQQISDKQQAVDRLKTRIAALQELQGRAKSAASVPPAPAGNPPATPQP
jgi:hypothetical protein